MRRTDCFLTGIERSEMNGLAVLAATNFYGFLLKRLTLNTAFGVTAAELVRRYEITGNFNRCKKIFEYFSLA